MEDYLSTLPDELKLEILRELSDDDLLNICRVNKDLNKLCGDWNFWAHRALDYFGTPINVFYNERFNPMDRYLYIKMLVRYPDTSYISAIDNGDLDALRILTNYPELYTRGVSVDLLFGESIYQAIRIGRLDIVKFLLANPYISKTVIYDVAAFMAVRARHLDIVHYLINNLGSKFDVNIILRKAIFDNSLAIVDILLSSPTPDLDINNAFILATDLGRNKITYRLLEDERVDPSINNNKALELAVENQDIYLIERLLADPRVNVNDEIMNIALQIGNDRILDMLRAD